MSLSCKAECQLKEDVVASDKVLTQYRSSFLKPSRLPVSKVPKAAQSHIPNKHMVGGTRRLAA